jgi:glucose uptake protein
MNILIALLPAIGWGLIPLITGKVKNSQPYNQIVGVGIGAVLVGIVVTAIQRPAMTPGVFALAVLSGMMWALGQTGQFISFTRIGVSYTMPISTGLQLVGNTLIGAIIFGEWQGSRQIIMGTFALILIIIGVILTSLSDSTSDKKVTARDLLFLLATTIGYWVYSAFPKSVNANAQSLFLPQTIGILIGAVLYAVFSKHGDVFKQKATWLDLFAGISFGIGGFAYIISAQMNGVTQAFIYSQLNVIIATLGGMTLLGEKKHGKLLVATLVGLVIIVVGAALS